MDALVEDITGEAEEKLESQRRGSRVSLLLSRLVRSFINICLTQTILVLKLINHQLKHFVNFGSINVNLNVTTRY